MEQVAAVAKPSRPQQPRRGRVHTIATPADIQAGVAYLRAHCPAMRRVHDLTGDPPLRRLAPGFNGLAQAVIAQQLSAASASAIWARTSAAVDPFDVPTLLATDGAVLRAAGLSRGKIQTLRAISEAIASGTLVLEGRLSGESLREALLAIRGVGPWTADIYALFSLGDADGFAPGDLALQLAAARALDLDARPSARELAEISARWCPWRGVAARLLWAFHVYRAPPRP